MPNDTDTLLKRQKVLADFGDFALQSDDLDEVLTKACHLVSEAMGTRRAKILEVRPHAGDFLLKAGVGWDSTLVGRLTLPLNEQSSESFALRERKPVIVRDIRCEERFDVPAFMKEAGVRALANVPIFLPGGRNYGLLQVDATEPRKFDHHDCAFLRTYATILGPVIDRILKQRDLETTKERFRVTLETVEDYAIFITDGMGMVTDWLPGAAAVYGWQAKDILGRSASILYTKEDQDKGEDQAEFEMARREGFAPDIRWHCRKDGSKIFINGSVRRLKSEDGENQGFIKIGRDVTERIKSQERQDTLVAELQHRTLNLMSVVQSVATQTAEKSADLGQFISKFRARMAALVRVHGLLSRLHEGERVTFRELLESEIAALDSDADKITLHGDTDIGVRASVVQMLALALHELGTNALKYGALHQPHGRLKVSWSVRTKSGSRWLHIDWHETGIKIAQPKAMPQGGGAGRKLIEEALPYQFGAKTAYVMTEDAVHCSIEIPLT